MFKPLVSHYDVKQLNDFSKAMINIRKGAITAKQKNDALKKQIDYFNLMTKTNFQFMKKPPKFLFSTKPISLLSKSDTNALWKHLKPRSVRSKKSGLSLWNQMYMILDYLGMSRPRVAARRGAAPPVARRANALAMARGVGRAAAFARAEDARRKRSDSAAARLSGNHSHARIPPIPSGSMRARAPSKSIDLQAIERQQGAVINLDNWKPPRSQSQSKQRDEDDEKGESINQHGVAEPPARRAQDYGVYNQFESAPANENEEQRAAREMRNRVALFKSSDKYRRARRNNNNNSNQDVAVQSKNKSKGTKDGRIGGNDNYFNLNQDDAEDAADSDFDIDLSGLPAPKPQSKPSHQYFDYGQKGYNPSSYFKQIKRKPKRKSKPVQLNLPNLGNVDNNIQPRAPVQQNRRSVSAQSALPSQPPPQRRRILNLPRRLNFSNVDNSNKQAIAPADPLPKTWKRWTQDEKKLYHSKKTSRKKNKMARLLDDKYKFKPSPNKQSSAMN